jgi:hypothetical protein
VKARATGLSLYLTTVALFLATGSSALASGDGAATVLCRRMFKDPQALEKLYGVSLTYAPVAVLNNKPQSFPESVLIEDYAVKSHRLSGQKLISYTNEITGIEPFGKNLLHDLGLKSIYDKYGPRVPEATVKAVMAVEAELPLNRQAIYKVKVAGDPDLSDFVMGFMRLFDGSLYQRGLRSLTSPWMPLERILKRQGKSTSAVEQKRQEGADVLEIGKYLLSEDLEAAELSAVRRSVLLWLVDQIESRGAENLKKTFYFVHTASAAHTVAYRRGFGFKIADRALSRGLEENENILMIEGDVLLAKLRELTK